MAIDLKNVNISLDEFQRISSGWYNAGEVKLHDVQKSILKPDLTRPKNPIKPVGGFDLTSEKSEIAQKIVRECRLQVQTDFFGDIYWAIARPGWFDS